MERKAHDTKIKIMEDKECKEWMVIAPVCVMENMKCIEIGVLHWNTYEKALRDVNFLLRTIANHTNGGCILCS